MPTMRYEMPFFVTPHAVDRFRERVADIPPARVIDFILRAMQNPGLPLNVEYAGHYLCPIYRVWYGSRPAYIPVTPGSHADGWPSIPTVYSVESALHIKYHTGGLKLLFKKEANPDE